jgi:hypothetical protein
MSISSTSPIIKTRPLSSIAEEVPEGFDSDISRIQLIVERTILDQGLQEQGNGLELIGTSIPSSDAPQIQAMDDRVNKSVRECCKLEKCCSFLECVCNSLSIVGLCCIMQTSSRGCQRVAVLCEPAVTLSLRASGQIRDLISALNRNR